MKKTCPISGKTFDVTAEDRRFLDELSPVINGKKFPLPEPTLCPGERQRRRLAQANQLNLYERKCDLTGASIISNYHPKSPHKVYRQEDWYSDAWDPLEYGQEFDFSRPFFEQWQELSLAVPRPAMHRGFQYDENADYTNYAGKNKDCYMIFDSDENWDCMYSYSLQRSKNCLECYRVRDAELCYEAIDSIKCYNCSFVQDCDNCSDSIFLKNCIGCRNCLMCSNLNNKEYYVENKQVSKEQFEEFRSKLSNYSVLQNAIQRFASLKLEYPQKFMHGVQNENVEGDYLTNCKDAFHCFDSNDLWDCRYINQAFMGIKNGMDIRQCGDAEKIYESCFCGYDAHSLIACVHSLGAPAEQLYSTYCPHSKNLFGCIGVMHKQYCILNKQYSKEQYEELVPRIIEHMQQTQEWGEFFPIALSTFAYNETMAQDHMPLTREEAEGRGYRWLEEIETRDQYMGPKQEIADAIADIPDEICSQILTCEASGKQYKVIPQELKLYRQLNLPLPRKRFFERHKDRMQLRNPRTLFDRSCMECGTSLRTSYAPDRPEKILCEPCYQQSLS